MERQVEDAVRRAIENMRDNLGEPLCIDDLARAAVYSKFHFSRVFARITGLSPGHFLMAIRMAEAKRLLACTALTITEISHRVGYSSVGSFSTRFSMSVGTSPSMYRQFGRASRPLSTVRRNASPPRRAIVHGAVWSPFDRPVFVGLFPERIIEGMPVKSAFLPSPGHYELGGVPPGAWYPIACSVSDDDPCAAQVGLCAPLIIRLDTRVRRADIALKPTSLLDPPVLLALGESRAAPVAAGA